MYTYEMSLTCTYSSFPKVQLHIWNCTKVQLHIMNCNFIMAEICESSYLHDSREMIREGSLRLCIMSGCGFLNAFTSVAGGSLSDDG